ncbi:MAG: polysaccharide biosynthesis protein [Actinomycetes bacterium]
MTDQFTKHRFLIQAGYDASVWLPAVALATLFRYEFSFSSVNWVSVLGVGLMAAGLMGLSGRFMGMYVHRWRYGTFEEIVALAKATVLCTAIVTVLNLVLPFGERLPVTATIMAGFVALFFMSIGRFTWRVNLERWTDSAEGDGREPIIVFGAGSAGLQMVSSMRKTGPFHPVAVLDDNPDLRNLVVKGVPVMGNRDALCDIATATGARHMVIAIPSASAELVRDLAARADECGLRALVLPPVGELLGEALSVGDMRPLTEADLLGRREITLDIDSVAGYLTGKRVLVTGAGGSIGSELCRQIHRFAPASLIMLDRDESALQAVQVSIEGVGLLDRRELVVCCIRDTDRLRQVFGEHQPEVIFHAAALKHLPLLEMHPEEGWKSNVWGTQNLLALSGEFGVERFVNISTDKAADPTSVLGQTKRMAEQLTSHAGLIESGTYLSVRFGNVLGSRGSVLPLFRAQIEAGGPVTVTDPEVTRFFMTIPEACELVIQAGALGADGEVLVLDMGEPVKIADLAKRLIAESGRQVEIKYTGLRPGEKLHEVLFSPAEAGADRSEHPLIFRVDVPPVTPLEASVIDPFRSGEVLDFASGRSVSNLTQRIEGR